MHDGIFIGICVGSGVLFILIIVIGFKCARKRHKNPPFEFPAPTEELLADEDYYHSQAASQKYASSPGHRYNHTDSQGSIHNLMSGDHHMRQTYGSYHDDLIYDDQPPQIPRLTSKSSTFADRSRSAIGPGSDSTSHDWYKTKKRSTTKFNGESFSQPSNTIYPNRHVSAASIDKLVLHNPTSSHCTQPRPEDDMMFRKMSPPHQTQSMQRSKTVDSRFISAGPDCRRKRSKLYRHGVRGNPNISPHHIQKSIPHIHYQPRLNYSSTSQNAPSSVVSTRRHSVKEIVDNMRWKMDENLTQAGQNMHIDSHCSSLENPNLKNSLTENPGVHGADFERYQEDGPIKAHYHSNGCAQGTRILSHQAVSLPQNSIRLRQQSSGNVHNNTVHNPLSRSQSQRNTHLTTPSPNLLNTPPPLPSPPKYPCLKPRPPVWTLRSPLCEELPTSQLAQSPPIPSTPPPPISPMYIPSSPVKSVFKPILMQTEFIPSVPLTSPPVSPRKPTAKPVLLQSSPQPLSPKNLHTLQKPSAKPVLYSSPISQPSKPTPPIKPSPSKPTAKPVLLASLPAPQDHSDTDPPNSPSSPHKPVAKPVLLQSPQTPPTSPLIGTSSSKYNRRNSLGGSFSPSTPPPLPVPPSPPPKLIQSPGKPVGKLVVTQFQYPPPPPPPPPPPLPILPSEQRAQFWSSSVPQPSSPTKPSAKPVLLSQQSPPPPAIPPLKYKTKIQVSPRIQEATNSPVTHKTIINISPRRHSAVYERARVFSPKPNRTENSSTSPDHFLFPVQSNIPIHEGHSADFSSINNDEQSPRQKHVQIISPNQECCTGTDDETLSPCTENEVMNFVQDVINTVSNETLLSGKTTVKPNVSDIKPRENAESPYFTPGQTSTPNASVTGIDEGRTDQSLIKSRLWQRRQRMASSDTMMADSDLQDSWRCNSSTSNCIKEDT